VDIAQGIDHQAVKGSRIGGQGEGGLDSRWGKGWCERWGNG
jgi:hypothetical protein